MVPTLQSSLASAAPGSTPAPTLRTVARHAGVSAMTVSRVLRNHPTISARVRTAVQASLDALGYRPDPQMAKLMHHLRVRRKPAFQAAVCALTTRGPDAPPSAYYEGILRGAEQQAAALGFGFSTLSIGTTREAWRTVPRMLRSRGVEGVLLLPMVTPAKFNGLLDWRDFSVVSTTSSVLEPELHAVLPNHYKNARLLAAQLAALGYRRVGVVLQAEQAQRLNHALTAAVSWHGHHYHNPVVSPLLYSGATPPDLAAWFKRERPDVIVTHTQRLCREFAAQLGLTVPGKVGFVSANTVPGCGFAGIDERPPEIGATAIDLLAGMIHRGIRDRPATPTTTQVPGYWVPGRSCPKLRGKTVKPAAR